ncbi:MAG: DNA-binding protein [Candidatus Micrarchaeales archaeon]
MENDEGAARKALQKRMQEQQLEQQKREILKRFLTTDAYERMANVRISNPEVYNKLIEIIISMYQSNTLHGKITEEQVKDLLARLTTKEEPKLEFKHK